MTHHVSHDDFWNNIDDWADNSGTNAELYDTVPNHKEMLQECIDFDDWVWAEEPTNNTTAMWPKPGNSEKEVSEYFNETNTGLKWDDEQRKFVHEERGWQRWLATPFDRPKDFPTICKFVEENKHQYGNPVISKLGPEGVIAPHQHKLKINGNRVLGRFLYNLCLNFPEGCRFAIHPTGLIPYRPGDIYKLHTHEGMHSVLNNTKEDRYHIMLRPMNHKEYVGDFNART